MSFTVRAQVGAGVLFEFLLFIQHGNPAYGWGPHAQRGSSLAIHLWKHLTDTPKTSCLWDSEAITFTVGTNSTAHWGKLEVTALRNVKVFAVWTRGEGEGFRDRSEQFRPPSRRDACEAFLYRPCSKISQACASILYHHAGMWWSLVSGICVWHVSWIPALSSPFGTPI